MNTYSKFTANVFLAKCTEQHEKGTVIPVTTKREKVNDCVIFNFIYQRDGFYYYSIVRADGFDYQQYCQNRADRRNRWAAIAEKKSNDYYERSNKDRAFLSLGEPVKVGHHSEKRHRKIIEEQWNNMGKSVAFSEKAEAHESKADYWERNAKDINMSMPESVDFFEHKLQQAQEYHEGLKSGEIERRHSMSMQYANRDVNDLKKKFDLAKRLWS